MDPPTQSEPRPARVGRWSEAALRVLRERYLTRVDGEVAETPEEMCWRVARAVATAEARFGRSPAACHEIATAFYETMVDGAFLPNSPTLMNAGKDNRLQFSACYVLPVGDSMREIFDSVKAAAIIHQSGGGCVAKGTRVVTSDGPRPIEELFERAQVGGRLPDVLSYNEKTMQMEWAEVQQAHKYELPTVRLFRVAIEGGASLVTSSWHPFYVLDHDAVATREAAQLRAGDWVLTSTGSPTVAATIGARVAWLHGLVLADGTFGTYRPTCAVRLRLCDPDRSIVARAVETLNARYGTRISPRRSGDHRYRVPMWELSSSSPGIEDLMRDLDIPAPGPKAATIRIPSRIWGLSRSEQFAFLIGFADGDGYVSKKMASLEISTASEAFAEDVIYLASVLGIRVAFHRKPGRPGEHPRHTVQLPLGASPALAEALVRYSVRAGWRRLARRFEHSTIGVTLPRDLFRPLLDKAGIDTHGRRAWRVATRIDGADVALQRWLLGGGINLRRALHILNALAAAPALSDGERRLVEMYRAALPAARRVLDVAPADATDLYDLSVAGCENYVAGVGGAMLVHNTGFAFSRLRPKNDVVRSTGGRASGPVSFLRVFNAATEAVKQGGARRGANMGVLRIDHPDVLEFVECKLDGGITNFNISVGVTDAFMDALARGADYDLVNPRTGQATGRLSAREVFERIVRAAWRTGDPGLLFLDRINRSPANPTPELGEIEATNPCGEQALLPNDACNLGSINLARFAREVTPGRWDVDLDALERVARLAVRFLDDVIEVNPYPLAEIDATVKANRRIGLGVMGWADLLFRLGIPYDSEEALALADRLMRLVRETGHDQSARLAVERGPFPNFGRSVYRDGPPLRNATVTTIAPTGTISMIAGCSSGIEPVFALAFEHRVKAGEGEARVLRFASDTFEQIARERGVHSEALMAEVARRGSLEGIAGLDPAVRALFKTAHEIHWRWHVRHQAAFQAHTDNGVSKTINLPHEATEDDVAQAYLAAWESGCVGITVFRDGCKGDQVLTHGLGAAEATGIAERTVKPRPHSLTGSTYRMETPIGTAFVTVNDTAQGEPFEVFVQVGKAGSDTMAVAEALGRLISLILRLPSPLSARRRVEEVASQLSRIGGGQPTGFGAAKVLSLPDALARVLSEHVGDQAVAPPPRGPSAVRRVGDLCRECGQATFIYEEGCRKCLSCGFNEC